MERCPNCGVAVRSGARFCTACGSRLTPSGGEQPVATGDAEASQDAQVAAPPAWESAPTAAERPATSQEEWMQRTPVASADLWPVSARTADQARSADDAEPAEAGSLQDAETEPDESERVAGSDEVIWPSSPWSSWTISETEGAAEGGTDGQPAAVAASADEPISDELPADVQAAFGEAPPLAEPATSVEAEESTATAAPSIQDEFGRQTGDALGRALALADELRGLLPAVAGVAGIDLAGAVAELSAARREASMAEAVDLDQLEMAVAAARERPREIDALTGLSGNVDGLAAVVAAHRRYAAAIDRTLALLGGSGATGTEAAGTGEDADG